MKHKLSFDEIKKRKEWWTFWRYTPREFPRNDCFLRKYRVASKMESTSPWLFVCSFDKRDTAHSIL